MESMECKGIRELTDVEITSVSGGTLFEAGAAGGALGGLAAAGTLTGAAVGSALGLAAAASFSIGYGIGNAIGLGDVGSQFGSWLYDKIN